MRTHPETHADPHARAGLGALSLAALGIVYGDIGTSPLYAMRESLEGAGHELPVTADNVLGIVSLVFWSLVIVISIKYLVFVMRADNDGEGGILALTSLVSPPGEQRRNGRWLLVLVGIFGTALLYGDGMITPAISVLSAVEGTKIAVEGIESWVVPIAALILVALFAVQSRGTAAIGRLFGPVIVVWFTTMAVLGTIHVVDNPAVLKAFSPTYAIDFFARNEFEGFLALGSVFLVVTGGEALYADMGHFGRRPIQLGWFGLVLPGLLLNYLGQGALLLEHPEHIDNPFYRLAPSWGVLPLAALATLATVIASQALISGAFSLTMQAVQLGYSPRVRIRHTSPTEFGQIYVPAVNWALMIACIGLVVGFGSSTSLAAAYGVAVTMTMFITTVLFYVVLRERFGWGLAAAGLVCGVFLVVDGAFMGANLFKVPDGGWFPLVVAAVLLTMMTTWRTGRRLVGARIADRGEVPLRDYVAGLWERGEPQRVPGTAVYLYSNPRMTPPALMANLRHNRVLHEEVIVLSISTDDVPRVLPAERAEVHECGPGVRQVVLHYGFMEEPDIPSGLQEGVAGELGVDPALATFFLGSESLRVTGRPGMAPWREHLFTVLSRNATNAATYFGLPPERTVTLGMQIEL